MGLLDRFRRGPSEAERAAAAAEGEAFYSEVAGRPLDQHAPRGLGLSAIAGSLLRGLRSEPPANRKPESAPDPRPLADDFNIRGKHGDVYGMPHVDGDLRRDNSFGGDW